MEAVVTVLQDAFDVPGSNIELIQQGPESWIWADTSLGGKGLPKFYVLSRSLGEGIEGYPVLTIRQAYSIRLDAWISVSVIVAGPDTKNIARSLAIALANHQGALAGFKFVVNATVNSDGDPRAGMDAANTIDQMSLAMPIIEDLVKSLGENLKPGESVTRVVNLGNAKQDPEKMN